MSQRLEELVRKRPRTSRGRMGLSTNYLIDFLEMVKETRSFSELYSITKIKEKKGFLNYLNWCVTRQLIIKSKVLPPNEDGKFVFYNITQRGREFLELIR